MSFAEVYSINIMPWSIANFIGCNIDNKEKIESAREDFKSFLLEKESWGISYTSQLTAWESFKEWQSIYENPDEFAHLDEDYEGTYEPDWISRLKQMVFDEAMRNSGNYNEFGGQL